MTKKQEPSAKTLMPFHFPKSGESVERYLHEISSIHDLAEDQKQELFEKVQQGDWEARELCLLAHLKLVVRIACHYTGYGLPLADMISEGNLGLLRAVELYDPKHGVAFETYASVWIRQRIHRAITSQAKVVRIPIWRSQRLRKLDRLHAELSSELGRDATVCELAERLGMEEADLALLEHDRTAVDSLDGEGDVLPLMDEKLLLPQERLSREELLEEIYACLSDLDDDELQILSLKFGLMDVTPVSYREMAPKLGKNREWIRKVGESALAKARSSLEMMSSIPRRLVQGKRKHTVQRLKQMHGDEQGIEQKQSGLSLSVEVVGVEEKNQKKSDQSLSLQHSMLIPWMDTLITIL